MAQGVTSLDVGSVALVVGRDGGVDLLIPDDEVEWHEAQTALAQLAIRFMNDPDWVAELAQELQRDAN